MISRDMFAACLCVCVFVALQRRRCALLEGEKDDSPISDAAAGRDNFLAGGIGLVTPSALVATTCRRRRCRCRRRRRRRRCRRGFVVRRANDVAGRPQTLLELKKLTHEVQIRTDDRTRVLHQFIRVHHRQSLVPHYVSNCDRGTARNASLTVHQHAASGLPRFL